MIKEKAKITKYNSKKGRAQIIKEYFKTIFLSFIFGCIITVILTIHARNEMLKNIYLDSQRQIAINKNTAQELIKSNDYLKDLNKKNFSVCMHVGEIYEAAGNYKAAEEAYKIANQKSKPKSKIYIPYYRIINTLTAQEKFDEALDILINIEDKLDKNLIRFKTHSYITIGDKYYSIGKFLSAAKNYEKADFYYDRFTKKDSKIEKSIEYKIINSYIHVADIMVNSGLNSEAVRFLNKAKSYAPDSYEIKYKLAIVLADLDPEASVEYFESLLEDIPQEIDYGVYNTALMKAANIADLDGRPTQAKYYRYKIRSIDMFINRKVIYKNDIEFFIKNFKRDKVFFNYPLKFVFGFLNASNNDIVNLSGDFILYQNDKPKETLTLKISNKDNPLLLGADEPNFVGINFKEKIYTKKDLDEYSVKIYIYKDKKYKTYLGELPLPKKSF